MESAPNPYTAPSSNLFGSSSQTTVEAVPAEAITQLQGTKPWVRFMSVMMWLGAAYLIFAGGMMMIGMAFGGNMPNNPFGGSFFVGIGAFYFVLAFAYIYPAVKMWQYGSAIKNLTVSRSADDLVAALRCQRSFWKYTGIMAISMIVLVILGIIAAVVFAVSGAMGNLPTPQ